MYPMLHSNLCLALIIFLFYILLYLYLQLLFLFPSKESYYSGTQLFLMELQKILSFCGKGVLCSSFAGMTPQTVLIAIMRKHGFLMLAMYDFSLHFLISLLLGECLIYLRVKKQLRERKSIQTFFEVKIPPTSIHINIIFFIFLF